MKTQHHSLSFGKSIGLALHSIQEFFNEKTEGLNLFQKIALTLYTLTTLFFLFAALYIAISKGFDM